MLVFLCIVLRVVDFLGCFCFLVSSKAEMFYGDRKYAFGRLSVLISKRVSYVGDRAGRLRSELISKFIK